MCSTALLAERHPEVVPGAAQIANVEQPEAVGELILGFLQATEQ